MEGNTNSTPAVSSSSLGPSSSPAVDARAIACDWISRVSTALFTRDESHLRTLFAPIAVLRDSLVFTWDLRSPAGPDAIAAHMCTKGGGSQGMVRGLTLDERPGLAPGVMQFDQPGAVCFAFTFDTTCGKGRGSARLFPRMHYGQVGVDEWIADSAYMMLDSLEGHDDACRLERPDPRVGHEIPWEVSEAERRKKIEEDPYVLVGKPFLRFWSDGQWLIVQSVGAGQTGLMVAARLQQLGLPTLVIEKNTRVGDNWRERYRNLALHTPKEQHTRESFSPLLLRGLRLF
jgi:hypothetical protein